MRVLVVEDDPSNAAIAGLICRHRGLEVVVAHDGAEAVKVMDPSVGLVLMDLHMPSTSGFEAISQLKADPASRHVPIVAVTALALREDLEEALAMGADEILLKPYTRAQLEACLERWLPYAR